jgi:hypothetical protein
MGQITGQIDAQSNQQVFDLTILITNGSIILVNRHANVLYIDVCIMSPVAPVAY